MSWTKEDGKVLTRTTSGGEKGEQLIIKRVEPGDEGGWLDLCFEMIISYFFKE